MVLVRVVQARIVQFGIPEQVLNDNSGEFNRKFNSELESLGVKPLRTTAVSPTQNAACERAGATWSWQRKQLWISFEEDNKVTWLCAMINHTQTNCIKDSRYSALQWVLECGLRLPGTMWSTDLALHSQLAEDMDFKERLGIQAAAQCAVIVARYDQAINRAFLAKSRATATNPVRET